MNPIRHTPAESLTVRLNLEGENLKLGRLAMSGRRIFFEFDPDFPHDALPVSPFHLRPPTAGTVIQGPARLFDGLHGIFNDSLPDGWGRLLMDRKLREVGIRPDLLTPLDRLAWTGSSGMGALCYHPEHPRLAQSDVLPADLDRLAREVRRVLNDEPQAVLDELLYVGGSPGGARPKAMVGVAPDRSRMIHGQSDLPEEYDHWLIKFASIEDSPETGLIENAYADMCRAAGIQFPETAVFPSSTGAGHFGIRRFDRRGNRRMHMHTACGLLHADHRLPSMGYGELLKATRFLTRNQRDVEEVFVRMVFNVYAHNRDDHTKNHSFLMNGKGQWRLSPAYDVTFSYGPSGEHALDVCGEGRNPGSDHLRAAAREAGISEKTAETIIERVRRVVAAWPKYARNNNVSNKEITRIAAVLNTVERYASTPVPNRTRHAAR